MKMRHKYKQYKRGSILIIVTILVMGLVLLFSMLTSAAMIGDRSGLGGGGGGKTAPDGSIIDGDTETADAGAGNGDCSWSSIKTGPSRTPSVNGVGVTVPIWKYVSQTQKVPATKYLTIHRDCTSQIKAIFQTIYNSPDKPPIQTSDTGCYCDRGSDESMHSWGIACDINWIENYCIWRSGGLCGPRGWWRPDTDIRSIPISSSITSAFTTKGWSRGLWTKKLDYMHYSANGY